MSEGVQWRWTDTAEDWLRWDAFLMASPRGHYLQLSDWLRSYHVYGFNTKLCLAEQGGAIVGGLAAVRVSLMGFTLYAVPVGPILGEGHESLFESAVNALLSKAREDKAIYAHLNAPVMDGASSAHGLVDRELAITGAYASGLEGIVLNRINSVNGFRWLDLRPLQGKATDDVIASFPSRTRRGIRKGLKRGLTHRWITEPSDIESVYTWCEHHAQENDYVIRPWADIRDTLLPLVQKGHSHILAAELEGDLVGGAWLFDVGRRLTYMQGATSREASAYSVGDYLQWIAIERSLELGYDGYDISVGGVASVVAFKERFNTEHQSFVGARHWVLRPTLFYLFDRLYNGILKHHKVTVSKLLKWFKR